MYNKKVVSASRKLTAARTKLRHAHTAYEQSLGARRALDDTALCTGQYHPWYTSQSWLDSDFAIR